MSPDISIIIPTRGNKAHLVRLLKSMKKIIGIGQAEVLVVLNPPSHRLDLLPDLFPDLRLRVLKSPQGVNTARNTGLMRAQGALCLFLDDDCWISRPDFLTRHQELHDENPWALAIGGPYETRTDNPIGRTYNEIQMNWLFRNSDRRTGECTTLLGGNFSIKQLAPMPLFDPRIVYGGSETEFFFRMHRRGHRFLLTDLPVQHEPEIHAASFTRKALLQGRTHRRLSKQGLIPKSDWIRLPSKDLTFYHELYQLFFNQSFADYFLFRPVRKIIGGLKKWHYHLCFYISNRSLF